MENRQPVLGRVFPVFAGLAVSLVAWLLPAASAAALGNPASLYNSPVVQHDHGAIVITANPAPSGAQWDLHLDPTHRYQIGITGAAIRGSFTLRTRDDEGEPVYRFAPSGTITLRRSGVSKLKLLFYSDEQDSSYRVDSITVDDCGVMSCNDDAALRAQVLAEEPQLAASLGAGDDLRSAELILEWATPRIPFASGGSD